MDGMVTLLLLLLMLLLLEEASDRRAELADETQDHCQLGRPIYSSR